MDGFLLAFGAGAATALLAQRYGKRVWSAVWVKIKTKAKDKTGL